MHKYQGQEVRDGGWNIQCQDKEEKGEIEEEEEEEGWEEAAGEVEGKATGVEASPET